MTCQETLAFYGGVTLGGAKWTRASRAERVAEVLAAVGLAHTAHTLVRHAASQSGGLAIEAEACRDISVGAVRSAPLSSRK
jgi:hypothetical protein